MAGQFRNITHVGQKYEINGKMTNVIPRSRIIALPLLTYDSPFNFLFQVKLSKRDSVHPSIKLQTFYFESGPCVIDIKTEPFVPCGCASGLSGPRS